MRGRTLARVASALYGTVLAGGAYFGAAGLAPVVPWRAALFVAGLLALLALERFARPGVVVRAALIVLVAAADTSGLARVLFLLVPFGVYLTRGRRAGHVAAAVCGAALIGLFTLAEPGWPSDREALGDLVMFGVGLVLAVAMAAATVAADADRARAEELVDELAASQQRVALLAAAEERNRVARDLHDSLGHHLTASAIQLEKAIAYRARDSAVADRAVTDAHASARAALADVRRSVAALRASPPAASAATPAASAATPAASAATPAADGAEPLAVRLVQLAARLRSIDTAVTCVSSGEARCPAEVEDVLFRVAQEGVTNALRHAGARSVTVTVHFAADVTTLAVRDDGAGLPEGLTEPEHAAGADGGGGGGFGLIGLRERLAAVGGALELTGPPGAGTTVTARVPA